MVRFMRYKVSNKRVDVGLEILDSAVTFNGIPDQNLESSSAFFQRLACLLDGDCFFVNRRREPGMPIGLQPHESNTVDVGKHGRDVPSLGTRGRNPPRSRIEVVQKVECDSTINGEAAKQALCWRKGVGLGLSRRHK